MKFKTISVFRNIANHRNLLQKFCMAILFVGVLENNDASAQTNTYSYQETLGTEVSFGDLKSLHQNSKPIDKNQYEESFKSTSNQSTKALNLHHSFVVFQSERESSADIYRVNSSLIFMNRSEFKSLSLSLSKGENFSVFQNEFDILISEKLAKEIFGSEDPINKIMIMDDQFAVLIKGVFKDSDLPFMKGLDFIAGMPTYEKINRIGKELAYSILVEADLIQ
jgi:hypothetical protein